MKSSNGSSPQHIYEFWTHEVCRSGWFDHEKEALVLFLLDSLLCIKSFALVSLGTGTGTICQTKDIFRPAIVGSAHAIIMAHNHPSGDPTPSHEDIARTSTILKAAHIVGLQLHDHVIIGAQNHCPPYISLREYSRLWDPPRKFSRLNHK